MKAPRPAPAPIRPLPCCRAGVEAVVADTARAFGRHVHDEFGIGLIMRGAQRSASGRGPVEAGAGDLLTVNPGEVHDGLPIDAAGRAWRMLYLAPALVDELAQDIGRAGFEFHDPAFRDIRLARLFPSVFSAMTGEDALGAEQQLLLLLAGLLKRQRQVPRADEAPGIAAARSRIDDEPAAALTLAELAREAGLSRWQLLRGFAAATGLTPHAYLMQRRLHRARALIAAGHDLAHAAADSGFADQSHMTRLFTRSFGFAPGAWAAAISFKTG
ncbi:AraC family transcriptional regulator [Pelomonas sp. KK5]|uniref:AraC family transcriptional regulator n=1 Tax=Pelomonas sp. KK5 TaxID=1855730 RepID=UPI0009F82E65|nr:AraC family transcriptional regulator [Pelomonas sp. KK5]